MKTITVNTLNGRLSLYDLCEKVGIKKRVRYFNFIEKQTKDPRNPFITVKKVWSLGFIFNNDFQIRHVQRQFWNLYKYEIQEIRERIPNQ